MTERGTHVLIIHHSLELGGTETQLLGVIQELCHQAKVTLVLYHETPLTKARINALPDGTVHFLHKQSGALGQIQSLVKLIRFATRQKPDTLLSFLAGTNIVTLIVSLFVRPRRLIWGLRVTPIDPHIQTLSERLVDWLFCYLSRFVGLIISNSDTALRAYEKSGLRAKAHKVIPNGINTAKFYRSEPNRKVAREIIGASENRLVIGIVSRVVPWKGYEIFLNAAKMLMSEIPDVQFVCIGSGEQAYHKSLLELQEDLGIPNAAVRWLGAREDTNVLINGLDIFSSVSTSGEALSNSLLEAVVTGIPVVATEVGDSRIIVADNGVLIRPGGPKQLSDAWLKIIGSIEAYKQYAATASFAASMHFNQERQAKMFCESVLTLSTTESRPSHLA